MPFKLKCTCGRSLTVADSLAGKKAKCPHCQAVIAIPAAGAEQPATAQPGEHARGPSRVPPGASAAVVSSGLDQLFDEVGLKQRQGPSCPKCGANVSRGVVLCTSCGLNFQTGEQAEGVKLASQEAEFDNLLLKEAASNMLRDNVSQERHSKAGFPWWILASLLLGSLCLGTAGVIVVDAALNEPEPESTFLGKLQREHFGVVAGVTLTIVGCMIASFAHLSLAISAFKQHIGNGLAVLMVQPYSLAYGIATWADNKSGVWGLILGTIISGLGLYLYNHYGGIRGMYL